MFAGMLAITLMCGNASARGIDTWSYAEMFAKSDFVVIARPVTATRDTRERTAFRTVRPPAPVIGVVTDFESLYVLKGTKRPRFTLHHYREVPSDTITVDGFLLAEFNPRKNQHPYLLFLIREPTGRFAPAASQTDPLHVSIQELSGITQ
jgi:hypothetical protein